MPGGAPFEGDPRYVLKKNLKKAADLGYTYYVGPELEYFYFKLGCDPSTNAPDPNAYTTQFLDRGGYFDLTTRDAAIELRRDTVVQLEKMGIGVEYAHHEVAASQHEIDMRYTDALTMADSVMTYRLVVKEVALRNGVYATFMPKPVFGINGSGMHVHQSLFKGERNAFFDTRDSYHLSKEARYFIGRPAEVRPGDYRRLQPVGQLLQAAGAGLRGPGLSFLGAGATGPTSSASRSTGPAGKRPPGSSSARRTRPATRTCVSPSCWPPGWRASKRNTKRPTPIEENVYEMTAAEREERGIGTLPGQPARSHPAHRKERPGAQGPRRPRLRGLHPEQEDRVGQLPDAGHRVRAQQVLADTLKASP